VPRRTNQRPAPGSKATPTQSTSRRPASESKSRRMTPRRPSETFDAESFVQAQAFAIWRKIDDSPISEEELKGVRKTMLNYIHAQSPAVEAKISGADGGGSAQSLSQFRAFIQTRDPCAAIDINSDDVTSVPWAFTRKSQPTRPWERTTYTAAPARSINMQRRLVSRSLRMFARRMHPTSRTPRTALSSNASSAGTLHTTDNIPTFPMVSPASALLSITKGNVGASRGAQVFRREILAGDYIKHTLVNVKANNSALSAAKLAAVSNATMTLGDKMSAIDLISRLANS
jgi:hypothetical protein